MKSKYNYYEYRLATENDNILLAPPISSEDHRLQYPYYFKVEFKNDCKIGYGVSMGRFSAEVLSCTGYWRNKYKVDNIPFILRKGTEYD